MRPLVSLALVLVLLLLLALPGCDRGSSKTPDELLAEDTTLAMDLARVNDALNDGDPDTSIGLTDDVPVPEATSDASEDRNARDADLRADDARMRPAPPPPRAGPTPPTPSSRAAPAPPAPQPGTSSPVRLGVSVVTCQSPAAADQQRCLLSLLAQYDVGLNAAYRDLIQRMRRDAGVAPGAPDLESVRELRAAQRSWLVYRDQECRRRTRSREGDLWAPVRARCLGQLSEARAAMLRAM